MSSVFLPVLTPHGHLTLIDDRDGPALEPELAQRLQVAFARGSGHGLLQLGASEVGVPLPPVFSYWREFGARYVTALCTLTDAGGRSTETHPPSPRRFTARRRRYFSTLPGGIDSTAVAAEAARVDAVRDHGTKKVGVAPETTLVRKRGRSRGKRPLADQLNN
jgi:hypothetical protein